MSEFTDDQVFAFGEELIRRCERVSGKKLSEYRSLATSQAGPLLYVLVDAIEKLSERLDKLERVCQRS